MLTLAQITAAHSKVKSGADFPAFFQDLINLGVTHYHTHVADGHTDYFGDLGFVLSSPPKYDTLSIAAVVDVELFKADLKTHQQGKTDYPTFCKDCAKVGVASWEIQMNRKICTYLDLEGNEILVEIIPG